MSESVAIDPNAQVSVEQDGRVLSGVGVSEADLQETMDRHAPEEPAADPAVPLAPISAPAEAVPASKGRERYSVLARQREEARADAATAKTEREAAIRERDEFKARLEQGSRQPEPTAVQEPVSAPAATRTKPSEDEIGTKYQTYAEFMYDASAWVFEQQQAQQRGGYEQQVRDVLARERSRDQFQTIVNDSQARARKAYPDFDTLLDGPVGQIHLGRDYNESVERVAFVAHHPQSEHIQHAILKDQALAERLRDSDPYTFGLTIAGLIPTAQPKARAWTPPPSPHPIVGASSPTTPTPSGELAAKGHNFDESGYREKRAAERGLKPKQWR